MQKRRENNKKSPVLAGLLTSCDREGIQTPNLLIRSETLYSVELRSLVPDLGLQR